MPGASNFTLLARDSDGRAWIYKPAGGERPLWDFPHGSLAAREIACHRISMAMALECVPDTRFANGPFGPGSAQRYLDEDFEWDPRRIIVEADPVLWPIVVLDLVTNNADRKVGHLLRIAGQPDGQDRSIWAIDNGLTFHVEDKLRTVLWSFAGAAVPPEMIEALDVDLATATLEGILDPPEIEATAARIERLIEDPVHPLPPNDRPPLPWPVW